MLMMISEFKIENNSILFFNFYILSCAVNYLLIISKCSNKKIIIKKEKEKNLQDTIYIYMAAFKVLLISISFFIFTF